MGFLSKWLKRKAKSLTKRAAKEMLSGSETSTEVNSKSNYKDNLNVQTGNKQEHAPINSSLEVNDLKLAEDRHIYPTSPKCLECGCEFESMPQSQKTCPNCGVTSLARKHYHTSEKILVPETKKETYDRKKHDYYKAKELFRSLKNIHPNFEKNIKNTSTDSTKNSDQPRKLPDAVWSAANELVMQLMSNNNLQTLSGVYFQMGLYLHKIGKDHLDIMQKANELELKRMGGGQVEILSAKEDSCNSCQRLDGKVFSVNEAIEKKPIPCKDCTMKKFNEDAPRGWCRCVYVPYFEF